MRKLAIVFAVLASSAAANAEELNAGQLYEFCTSKDPVATSACRFFILGAVVGIGLGDGAIMGPDRQLRERKKTIFCIPENVSQSQMVSVFVNAARLIAATYPDDLKMPAVSAVGAYMNRAYPCSSR